MANHLHFRELVQKIVEAGEQISEKRLVGEIEAVACRERKAVLSGKIVQIRPVPRMYVAMDGTGVPVVPRETEWRKSKDETGRAKTREAKLGCVFKQVRMSGRWEQYWEARAS